MRAFGRITLCMYCFKFYICIGVMCVCMCVCVCVCVRARTCLLVCGLEGCVDVRARWREEGGRGRRAGVYVSAGVS